MSEIIIANKLKKDIKSISLPSKFGPTRNYEFLLEFHKLNEKKIKTKFKNFCKYLMGLFKNFNKFNNSIAIIDYYNNNKISYNNIVKQSEF